MNSESTWQQIALTWRTDEHRAQPLSEQLADRVHRQSRRLHIILVGEIALTIVMLVFSLVIVARTNAAATLRVAAIVLLYSAGVWAFMLWNRRGIWRPFGESTAEFVQLLRLRAERRIQAARFTQVVVGFAAIFVGREVAIAWQAGSASSWQLGVWTGFAVYAVSMIAWSLWYDRSARREIRELDALARDLAR